MNDVERQRVNAVVFDDKCDADTFLMLDGQIVNVQGDLDGPLEVLCVDECAAYVGPNDEDDVVFEFFLDPENPWTPYRVTKSDLDTLSGSAPAEHDQYRYSVFSMNGVADVCYVGCESSAPTA